MCIGKQKLEFRMQLWLEKVIMEGLVEKGMFEVKLESMGGGRRRCLGGRFQAEKRACGKILRQLLPVVFQEQ